MLREAIFHQSGGVYAYPIARDILLVQLRTAKDDIYQVNLVFGDRYHSADAVEHLVMEKYATDQLFDYYRAEIQVKTCRFRYMFLLDDGKERLWYNEFGFHSYRPTGYHSGYFHYPYSTEADLFTVPDWVHDAVVYQIFPDRFYNGDLTNDPQDVRKWGELPKGQMEYFGGDLAGIIAKLPYLTDLGINTIYLTPIFEAVTNHKYDTTDYFKIDPRFGDDETFRKLVQECHKRGMRVILDAVFNHCGYYLAQFQDVVEKGEQSPYRDWFYIRNFPVTTEPVSYEAFADDVWRMPKLRTANPEVKEFLLQVAEYWIREFDIDGWRLDVANEIDHVFWREFRQRVKALKPDAYIIGEIWHHSAAYLQGDQFDAVMNYHFRDAILCFFGERSLGVDEFDGRLTQNRVTYKKTAVEAAWNLLGSHDTARILHNLKKNKQVLKLIYSFQMTYLGLPYIYAGDEIGMEGADDPDNRRCMIWDEAEQDQALLQHVRRLIAIRHEYEPLRRGEYRTVYTDETTGLFVFERFTAEERVLVIINNGLKAEELEIDRNFVEFNPGLPVLDLLQGKEIVQSADGMLRITVPSIDAVILGQ